MSDTEDLSLSDSGAGGMFDEPADYYKPPAPPTKATFTRTIPNDSTAPSPTELTLHLVGSSPLWGHLLWNAGKATTDYIDAHRSELVTGKNVLELGAGAGLPSLVSSLSAKRVVLTDYPDLDLVQNLELNRTSAGLPQDASDRIHVSGYIWGDDITPLLDTTAANGSGEFFDLIILSDLVFNHTEHHKLLKTCDVALKPATSPTSDDGGRALVVFSPHRPWLFEQDMGFFTLAQEEYGYKVLDKFELDYTPMFEEDDETKELRGKVFGFLLAKA